VLQFGECKDPENHADRIQFAFESLLGPKTTRDTWEEIKQLQQFVRLIHEFKYFC